MKPTLDLVGVAEIEERHGVPRYRVRRFLLRGLWPDPVVTLAAGQIFDGAAVRAAVERLKGSGQL